VCQSTARYAVECWILDVVVGWHRRSVQAHIYGFFSGGKCFFLKVFGDGFMGVDPWVDWGHAPTFRSRGNTMCYVPTTPTFGVEIKMFAPNVRFLSIKCTKFNLGWGSAQDPAR